MLDCRPCLGFLGIRPDDPTQYRDVTQLDLRDGPVLVQVRDHESEYWRHRYLFSIADECQLASYPFVCRETKCSRIETRYKFARILKGK
jgi:hypothetical protein